MNSFGKDSLAEIAFTVHWTDGDASCKDSFLARRVNTWRDVLPVEIEQLLQGCEAGQKVVHTFGAGKLVETYDERKVLSLPLASCGSATVNGRSIGLQRGRFYPLGLFAPHCGVFAENMLPARVIAMDNSVITVDTNHPLAAYSLTLEAKLLRVQQKRSDTGGQLTHWAEAVCDGGPGMQACLGTGNSDYLNADFFARDNDDDAAFYATPRIISHVDAQASRNLQKLYATKLTRGMHVLDLMSSVDSHLPENLQLEVTGLGMNGEELARNPALSGFAIHDVNAEPDFRPAISPVSVGKAITPVFDAVICSLSVEYLTNPVAVFRAVHGSLKDGGVVMVGISNRWFPGKIVKGWADLHEFERMGYIREILRQAGFGGPVSMESIRNDWRPMDDAHFTATRGVSDPVYVVSAMK